MQKRNRYATVRTETPSRIIRVDTAAALQVLEADSVFRYRLNQLLKYRKVSAFFSAHPVFQDLPADTRSEFAAALPVCMVHRGERIFAQGDRSTGIVFILSGTAEVHHVTPSGEEVLIDMRRDLDMLGELTEGKRLAYSATAASDADLLIMNYEALRFLQKRHSDTAKRLDEFIHRHAKESLQRIHAMEEGPSH